MKEGLSEGSSRAEDVLRGEEGAVDQSFFFPLGRVFFSLEALALQLHYARDWPNS